MFFAKRTSSPRALFPAVLFLSILSILSLLLTMFFVQNKDSAKENDAFWFEAYFQQQGYFFSPQQRAFLSDSIAIHSDVAEDAGIEVHLSSAFGTFYQSFFKLDFTLPEERKALTAKSFESAFLRPGDTDEITYTISGPAYRVSAAPDAAQYSFLANLVLQDDTAALWRPAKGARYVLQLNNLRCIDKDGGAQIIEGQWNFSISFSSETEPLEFLERPVQTRFPSEWEDQTGLYFEAELSSFLLTETAAFCRYTRSASSIYALQNFKPRLILKDGRTLSLFVYHEASFGCHLLLRVPISLDEVDCILLPDGTALRAPRRSCGVRKNCFLAP